MSQVAQNPIPFFNNSKVYDFRERKQLFQEFLEVVMFLGIVKYKQGKHVINFYSCLSESNTSVHVEPQGNLIDLLPPFFKLNDLTYFLLQN